MKKYILFGLIALSFAAVIALYWQLSIDSDHDPNAPIVNLQLPAKMTQSEQRGKILFEANCAFCHGPKSGGVQGGGSPLVYPSYKPSRFSDEEFQRAVAQGVPEKHWDFGKMPPIKGVTREEVADIIAFIRTMQTNNGLYKNDAK